MASSEQKTGRHFTEVARRAGALAKAAKRAGPDTFGVPQMFIVKASENAFTWELRRFGGLVLQRGTENFVSQTLARAAGDTALAVLCAMPDQPTIRRELQRKGAAGID